MTGLADSFNPNTNIGQLDGVYTHGGAGGWEGLWLAARSPLIGGQTRNYIARLDRVTGAADSFDPNANIFVYSVAIQADGKILAAGGFSGANSIGGQNAQLLRSFE